MSKFKEIPNIYNYIKQQIILSNATIYQAKKVSKVKAVPGKVGEKVTTIMKDGHVETENVINIDTKTGQPDWIITNPDGERYVIPDRIFKDKYEKIDKNIYKKKYKKVIVLEIKEDISFIAPWREKMRIKKGGFLVINSINHIYGIQRKEFFNTYKIINVINKENIKEKLLLYYYPEVCDLDILTMKERLERILIGQKIEGNIKEKREK